MSKRLTRDEALRRAAGHLDAEAEVSRMLADVMRRADPCAEDIADNVYRAITAHAAAARAYIAYADSLVFGGPEEDER